MLVSRWVGRYLPVHAYIHNLKSPLSTPRATIKRPDASGPSLRRLLETKRVVHQQALRVLWGAIAYAVWGARSGMRIVYYVNSGCMRLSGWDGKADIVTLQAGTVSFSFLGTGQSQGPPLLVRPSNPSSIIHSFAYSIFFSFSSICT